MTDTELTAMAALAAGYLRRWPDHEPHPLSYVEAAELIGVSEPSVRRSSDRVRERLSGSDGLALLSGPHALRATIEHLIATGQLLVDHLRLVEGDRSP